MKPVVQHPDDLGIRIGLGAMPLSTPPIPDRSRARETVAAALAAGVALIDTADVYNPVPGQTGHNEELIAGLLRELDGDALVATKGGMTQSADGDWSPDGRPSHLRAACERSLLALGVESIDLYQLHRPDPAVPFAESVGALAELRAEGKVRDVGVSNVSVAQLREAAAIVPLLSVQNELSLRVTAPLEEGVLAACEALGVAFLAWSPLGGPCRTDPHPAYELARRLAAESGATVEQTCLAWVLQLSPAVRAVVGATRPTSIAASSLAADLRLDPDAATKLTQLALAEPDRSAYGG